MQKELKEYIEGKIIPQYAKFDSAHREDHARSVVSRSLELSKYYDVNPDIVYVAAACHDLGLSEGREKHHLVSGRMIRDDIMLRRWFSEDEIEVIAQAAEDHRASLDNPPRSIYGKIVAEADRLIDPDTVIRRTVQYGFSHYPEMSRGQMWKRFRSHLTAKYGEDGYLKLWIPESDNAEKLIRLRRVVSDEKELRRRFDTLYREEKYDPYVCDKFRNDPEYRRWHCAVVAAKPGTVVLGLHKPDMRTCALEVASRYDWRDVLHDWADTYSYSPLSHDEISIWGLCLDYVKCGVDERLAFVDEYIPAIDNWANCDTFCCNAKWALKASDSETVWNYIREKLASPDEFARRVGIVLMMRAFLDEMYIDRSFNALRKMNLTSGEPYYVRMAVAWLLATALAKSPEKTRGFVSSADSGIPSDILSLYVRKARESFLTRTVSPFF